MGADLEVKVLSGVVAPSGAYGKGITARRSPEEAGRANSRPEEHDTADERLPWLGESANHDEPRAT
jgi:hypothetical protein